MKTKVIIREIICTSDFGKSFSVTDSENNVYNFRMDSAPFSIGGGFVVEGDIAEVDSFFGTRLENVTVRLRTKEELKDVTIH